MLMIIPLEILMKIKNVAKVLKSQNFMTHTNKENKGNSKKNSKKNSDEG